MTSFKFRVLIIAHRTNSSFSFIKGTVPETCNKRCTFQHIDNHHKGPKHTAHAILSKAHTSTFSVAHKANTCSPEYRAEVESTRFLWCSKNKNKTSSFCKKLHFRHDEFQDCNQPLLIFFYLLLILFDVHLAFILLMLFLIYIIILWLPKKLQSQWRAFHAIADQAKYFLSILSAAAVAAAVQPAADWIKGGKKKKKKTLLKLVFSFVFIKTKN